MNTARARPGGQAFDFVARDEIEVAGDRLFEAGRGGGEFESFTLALPGQDGENIARTEGVASADPVDDLDLVNAAAEKCRSRREAALARGAD